MTKDGDQTRPLQFFGIELLEPHEILEILAMPYDLGSSKTSIRDRKFRYKVTNRLGHLLFHRLNDVWKDDEVREAFEDLFVKENHRPCESSVKVLYPLFKDLFEKNELKNLRFYLAISCLIMFDGHYLITALLDIVKAKEILEGLIPKLKELSSEDSISDEDLCYLLLLAMLLSSNLFLSRRHPSSPPCLADDENFTKRKVEEISIAIFKLLDKIAGPGSYIQNIVLKLKVLKSAVAFAKESSLDSFVDLKRTNNAIVELEIANFSPAERFVMEFVQGTLFPLLKKLENGERLAELMKNHKPLDRKKFYVFAYDTGTRALIGEVVAFLENESNQDRWNWTLLSLVLLVHIEPSSVKMKIQEFLEPVFSLLLPTFDCLLEFLETFTVPTGRTSKNSRRAALDQDDLRRLQFLSLILPKVSEIYFNCVENIIISPTDCEQLRNNANSIVNPLSQISSSDSAMNEELKKHVGDCVGTWKNACSESDARMAEAEAEAVNSRTEAVKSVVSEMMYNLSDLQKKLANGDRLPQESLDKLQKIRQGVDELLSGQHDGDQRD